MSIDEFVNELLRQQNAEPTRTHSSFLAYRDMADRVVDRVSDRRVGDFVKRKTGAGISNVAGHHVTGTDVFDLDILARVKSSAMLDSR